MIYNLCNKKTQEKIRGSNSQFNSWHAFIAGKRICLSTPRPVCISPAELVFRQRSTFALEFSLSRRISMRPRRCHPGYWTQSVRKCGRNLFSVPAGTRFFVQRAIR
jgi:hypothetical protein